MFGIAMQTLEKINKMTGNSEMDMKGCFLKMIKEIKKRNLLI